MAYDCIRCLAETDNDCDICDRCLAEAEAETNAAYALRDVPSCDPFRFDRYRDGKLMAEGIVIEQADTLERAILKAIRLCNEPRTVLVYQPAPAPAAGGGLKADCAKLLPGGVLDDASFEEIEAALDRAEAPCCAPDGRWLKLPERIAALAAAKGNSGPATGDMVLVPTEPTEAMLDAAVECWDTHDPGPTATHPYPRAIWAAMLAAAKGNSA